MRILTKLMLTGTILFSCLGGVKAKTQIGLPGPWNADVERSTDAYPATFTFKTQYSGGGSWVGADWSGAAYEYVWMQYSGYTGSGLKIKIEYDEYVGSNYVAEEFSIVDASGFFLIPINKTSIMTGNKDGNYSGDLYCKHVRSVILQNYGTGESSITIQGIWVGTKSEYLTDIGYDNTKNHVLKVTNNAVPKANIWDNSTTYTFPSALTSGTKYTVTAKICAADVTGGTVMKFVLAGSTPQYGGEIAILANTFTQVSADFTAGTDNTGLEIDLGFANGIVYIDDVSVVAEGTSTNLVSNGDFEEPLSTEGWSIPGWTGQALSHAEQEQGVVALGAQKITIGATGWATTVAFNPLSVPAGVDAYFAKYDAVNDNVKLTKVDNTYQWGCIVVNGTAGDYYFPQIAAGDVTADGGKNGMQVSWGAVEGDGSTIFVLANGSSGIGFYKLLAGDKVPSGKAYMVIPASSNDFIGFDDTTGLNEVKSKMSEVRGDVFFDLQGRRVANPTKGLYIVNGKKVIIK